MAYKMTLLPFLVFAGAALALAFALRPFRRGAAASSRILCGVAGAALGFLLAPLGAAAGDVIPNIMVQPRYFTEPFFGCISPVAIGSVYVSSALGVFLGFAVGSLLAPKLHGRKVA